MRAVGFLLPTDPLGAPRRVARALELCQPGVELLAVSPELWLVRMPDPRVVQVDQAVGIPVVSTPGGHYAAAPLSPRELAAVSSAHGPSVLWLRGGTLQRTPLDRCTPVDLSRSLAIPRARVLRAAPLVAPRMPGAKLPGTSAPPSLEAADTIEVAPAERVRSVREVLAEGVPEVSPAQRAMLQWLQERKAERDAAAQARASKGAALATRTGTAGSWLPWLARLWRRARSIFGSLTLRSPFGGLVRNRQLRYLREMLERFDRGDLLEALRYAIPLGADGLEPSSPALATPTPRDSLRIEIGGARASPTAFDFGPGLYQHMQRTYRAAAERLHAQGRHYEAAFVYAELLKDVPAAVTMLERARLWQRAAELAESHGLTAGLVVRLWFLARRTERAIAYAAQHDAFADAVRRLESSDANAARALRVTWAQRLAQAGRLGEAVEAIWPVAQARRRAAAWVESVIAAGGVPAARMLARAFQLGVGDAARLEQVLVGLLFDPSHEGPRCRLELARSLVRDGGATLPRYAAALLRALVVDDAAGVIEQDRDLRRALERASLDRVLVADLPPQTRPTRRWSAAARELTWASNDVGTVEIHDVVRAANGGFALALGESGIRVSTADGRTRAQLAQPATRFVLADNGMRALAAVPRGVLTRLARVDLLRARAEHWCDLALVDFAKTFDGERFFVARDRELSCLDVLRDDVRARWHVRDEAFGPAPRILRNASELLVMGVQEGVELWCYQLPGLVLRRRQALPPLDLGERELRALALSRSGAFAHVSAVESEAGSEWSLGLEQRVVPLDVQEPVAECALTVTGDWAVVTYRVRTGMLLDLVHLALERRVFRLRASGASALYTRVQEAHLVVADDRGRVLELELSSARVTRDLRVSA